MLTCEMKDFPWWGEQPAHLHCQAFSNLSPRLFAEVRRGEIKYLSKSLSHTDGMCVHFIKCFGEHNPFSVRHCASSLGWQWCHYKFWCERNECAEINTLLNASAWRRDMACLLWRIILSGGVGISSSFRKLRSYTNIYNRLEARKWVSDTWLTQSVKGWAPGAACLTSVLLAVPFPCRHYGFDNFGVRSKCAHG